MRQVVKFDEQKDLPAFGREFRDGLLQERDLLLRPDDGFDRRAGVRLVDRAIGFADGQCFPMLLTAVVVDDEIRGDAKEKRTGVDEGVIRGCLEQAEKRVLQQVLGRFRTAQATGEELLQVLSMLTDECRQFHMGEFGHGVGFRSGSAAVSQAYVTTESYGRTGGKGMFDFQVHSAGAEYRNGPVYPFEEKGKARRSVFKSARGHGNGSPAGNTIHPPMSITRIDFLFSDQQVARQRLSLPPEAEAAHQHGDRKEIEQGPDDLQGHTSVIPEMQWLGQKQGRQIPGQVPGFVDLRRVRVDQ